jgi:hypothetical protein
MISNLRSERDEAFQSADQQIQEDFEVVSLRETLQAMKKGKGSAERALVQLREQMEGQQAAFALDQQKLLTELILAVEGDYQSSTTFFSLLTGGIFGVAYEMIDGHQLIFNATGLVCDGDSVGVFSIGESFAMVSALYSSFGGGGVVHFCDGGVNTSLVTVRHSSCRFIAIVFLLFLLLTTTCGASKNKFCLSIVCESDSKGKTMQESTVTMSIAILTYSIIYSVHFILYSTIQAHQ